MALALNQFFILVKWGYTSNQPIRLLYWLPRILTVLFLVFLTLFSLDVISPEANFPQILVGLLIHNLPVLVMLGVLIIAWKKDNLMGAVFLIIGSLYALRVVIQMFRGSFEWYMVSWIAIIAGPAWMIGVLYLLNGRQQR